MHYGKIYIFFSYWEHLCSQLVVQIGNILFIYEKLFNKKKKTCIMFIAHITIVYSCF